jgi:hypothetical protein
MNSDNVSSGTQPLTVGWREWLALPELGVPAIKAKVDTGARSSCLHVLDMETFEKDGAEWVRFVVQPLRRRPDISFQCVAPVIDRRRVTDSGGHSQSRVFIETEISLGGRRWRCELNLTRRDNMLFPMLLGRTALAGAAVIEPGKSFSQGKQLARSYTKRTGKGTSR